MTLTELANVRPKRVLQSPPAPPDKRAVFHLPGYTNLPFRWFQYLKDTRSVAAPVNLFNKVTPVPDSPPRRDRFRNSGVP